MKKIFYSIGILLAVIGLFVFLFKSGLIGAVLGILGFVTVIATLFVTKLIDAGNQTGFDGGSDGKLSLEMKINQAISGARQNKFKAQSEIRRLTAWSNDAIFNTYHAEYEKVPANSYKKDELLEKYDEIRDNYGASLSFETMEKCDGIVRDYKQKIDGYKSRIEVFDKQEQEYVVLKEKIKAVKQHEKLMKKLDAHQNKLESASDKEAMSIVAGDPEMAQLSMGDIEKEVAEKEEYFRQLDKINYELKQ
ncbi:MAG: hypothetical protein IKQ46_03460 [Bacteroidales bacterium]|nr:hypothetical protein [Bacteroidales bacterium]